MSLLGRAVSVGLPVAGFFLLIDLWQIGLRDPGSLEPKTLAWLLVLWLVSTIGAAGVLAAIVGRWWPLRIRARVAGVLIGVGVWLLGQEVVLGSMQPLSHWRPVVVLAALGFGGVAGTLAARWWRAWSRTTVTVGLLALALGMVGAVRGFGTTRSPVDEGAPVPEIDAPSVLVVLIDTLRADHLGCYGYDRPTSPNLDRFAADGTIFLAARSQSTWTKPATASLFTGRYPSQHQAYLERSRLPESEVLLPEVLSKAGYRTAVFSGNPWVTPEYGFDQGVEHFHSVYDERFARVTLYMRTLKRLSKLIDRKRRLYNFVKSLVQHPPSTTARDLVLADELFRWLDQIDGQPFYAHLHLMSPHHPYDPPKPFDRFVPDPSHEPVTVYPRKSYFFFDEGAPLDAAALADMVARYDGDVAFVDDVVGRILAGLDARGLADRTLVVVTSDHGEEFYDHRNWGHGQSVYEELTHVPLILRHPKAFPAGKRVERPVMTVDLMPTVLDFVGIEALPGLAGRSLLGEPEGASEEAYTELVYRYGAARALVDGTRKVLRMTRDDDARVEGYDLGSDPTERQPLPSADPGLVERMDAVTAWAEAHQSAPTADVEIDDDMAKRLKQLGYLQ